MRPFAKIFLAFSLLLQPLAAAAQVQLEDALRADVEFLCSPLCEGRAAGTRGGVEAAAYIARRLSALGYEVAAHSFAIDSTRVGHNIIAGEADGWVPPEGRATRGTEAGGPSRRDGGVSPKGELPKGGAHPPLTVVMACYDGIGSHDGQVYPGADSNASGVAAMLAGAAMLVVALIMKKRMV